MLIYQIICIPCHLEQHSSTSPELDRQQHAWHFGLNRNNRMFYIGCNWAEMSYGHKVHWRTPELNVPIVYSPHVKLIQPKFGLFVIWMDYQGEEYGNLQKNLGSSK